MARLLEALVVPAKLAALAFVFIRFHGSFVGLAVVLGMAALWFRPDRAFWRWVGTGVGVRQRWARRRNVMGLRER